MRVFVKDVRVVFYRPRVGVLKPALVIRCQDEYGHSEVVIVDAEKSSKASVEEIVRLRYASFYGIKHTAIDVEWLVELPIVRT